MTKEFELKDIFLKKKGIQIFLHIENDSDSPPYTDLRRITNISQHTLDDYLNRMFYFGIIEIKYFKEKPRGKRNRYQLTEKGKKLSEPIKNICLVMQKLDEETKALSKG